MTVCRLQLAGAVAYSSWRQCWKELSRTVRMIQRHSYIPFTANIGHSLLIQVRSTTSLAYERPFIGFNLCVLYCTRSVRYIVCRGRRNAACRSSSATWPTTSWSASASTTDALRSRSLDATRLDTTRLAARSARSIPDAIGLGIDFQSHLSRPAPPPTPAPRALGLEATLTFYSYCILPLSLTGASLILVTFQLDSLLWLRVQVIIISTRLCVYELTFNNWGFFPTYLSNFTHYSLLFS